MNRRTLLKNLSLSAAAAMAMPTWANGWGREQLPIKGLLTIEQEALLADLVEAIIPETDKPGALAVGVDKFVQAYAEAMFSADESKRFYEGLKAMDAYTKKSFGKTFSDLDKAERKTCLLSIVNGEDNSLNTFVGHMKELTIQAYTRSEWYMTNIENYTMAPGFYHGCVPM